MNVQDCRSWLPKGVILLTALVVLLPVTALGTWHVLLNEHFENPASTWPWGQWEIQIANPSWGIQNTYWHVGIGTQACWIMGYPFQNGLDPEYDQYTPNFYRWMYWGPFSLADAEDAQCTFYLLNRSQASHDSVWWGAAVTNPTSFMSYYQGGRFWGNLNDFELYTYKLSELDSMGHTISFCGRPTVYIGWFFRANGDATVGMGAIIDDVVLGWDDGMFDLEARNVRITDLDSVQLYQDPVAGDTVLFRLQWLCAGNDTSPEFNMHCTLNDSVVYSERRTAVGETYYDTYSGPWVVEPGDWVIRWELDIDDEVVESDETNNDVEDSLHVDVPNTPPMIVILTPPAEGDTADQSYLITWLDEDPDDNATIFLYYDTDTLGYYGQAIPGGQYIEENSPADSLRWNTNNLPHGATYWILARIDDPYTSYMTYSDGPLHIYHPGAVGPDQTGALPTEYSLAPAYPNPFNASTTFTFGLPHHARVKLQVFNLLGQQVADVVDSEIAAGYHWVQWTPSDLPSGVYIARLQVPGFTQTRKVILMK
jgi:hypothetical protein